MLLHLHAGFRCGRLQALHIKNLTDAATSAEIRSIYLIHCLVLLACDLNCFKGCSGGRLSAGIDVNSRLGASSGDHPLFRF